MLAAPIAYGLARRWLGGYAYRVALGGSVFVLALVLTMGLALLTVGRQTLKTSRINPARSIKCE